MMGAEAARIVIPCRIAREVTQLAKKLDMPTTFFANPYSRCQVFLGQ